MDIFQHVNLEGLLTQNMLIKHLEHGVEKLVT